MITRIVRNIIQEPAAFQYKVAGRVHPRLAWRSYLHHAAAVGLDRPAFHLSFDCDTEKDIEVVWNVHQECTSRGIIPTYAVPGEMLHAGRDIYEEIFRSGASFINHGHAVHTIIKDGEYVSTLFYDQIGPEAVANDIRKGHQDHVQVLGHAPTGFRTPHFGTYQNRAQLRHLYATIGSLGYRFSTSTVPTYGLRHGPMVRQEAEIWELPVTGCHDHPTAILDSYGFRFVAGRKHDESDYVEQFHRTLSMFRQAGTGFMNIYADPSQVHDWPAFFECLEEAAPFSVSSYEDVLDIARRQAA